MRLRYPFKTPRLALLMGAILVAFPASPQTAPEDAPFGKVLIRRGPRTDAEPQSPLLTFNLVVLDAHGEPFPGLRDVDLEIRDDGQPMRAAFCRPLESAEPDSAPLRPNEFTNRSIGSGSQSTLLLLDLLNENLAERGLAWNEIVNTVRQFEPHQRLYVYLLTREGTLYPIHALPDVRNRQAAGDDAWLSRFQEQLDLAIHDVNRIRPWELEPDVDARVQTTISALRNLGSYFALQPGRKSLVWISHGIPVAARGTDFQWHDYTLPVMRLGSELARSGIAVYPVNQAARAAPVLSSFDTLQQFADLTGGLWFPSDALDQALRQAA